MTKERLKWVVSGLEWETLTKWEEMFVESVEDQFKRKGSITDRQEEILEKIYREKGRR